MTNQVLKCTATPRDDESVSQWFEEESGILLKVSLSGIAWFLAAAWLNLSDGFRLGLTPAAVVGALVMNLTLLLLAASGPLQKVRSRARRAE
jgi:hypothetical protein